MNKIWFVHKTYGWGWTPSSWEGWTVMVVYFILLVVLFRRADLSSHSGSDTLISFSLPFIVLTIALLVVTYWRGEPPRWQWGRKDTDRNSF